MPELSRLQKRSTNRLHEGKPSFPPKKTAENRKVISPKKDEKTGQKSSGFRLFDDAGQEFYSDSKKGKINKQLKLAGHPFSAKNARSTKKPVSVPALDFSRVQRHDGWTKSSARRMERDRGYYPCYPFRESKNLLARRKRLTIAIGRAK